jgi:hypothetical protein
MTSTQGPRIVAFARLGFGAGTILAPRLAGRMLGLPGERLGGVARTWTLVFGHREMALGAATLATEGAPASVRRNLYLLNAAVDAADAAAALYVADRHPSLRAVRPMLVPGALASVATHLAAAAGAD